MKEKLRFQNYKNQKYFFLKKTYTNYESIKFSISLTLSTPRSNVIDTLRQGKYITIFVQRCLVGVGRTIGVLPSQTKCFQ